MRYFCGHRYREGDPERCAQCGREVNPATAPPLVEAPVVDERPDDAPQPGEQMAVQDLPPAQQPVAETSETTGGAAPPGNKGQPRKARR